VLRVYNPPTDKKSPKELEQRAKFGLVNGELANFREVIIQGHKDKYAIRTLSGFMLRNWVQGVYPYFTVDYSKLNVAAGPLQEVSDVVATSELASTIGNLTWDTTIGLLGISSSETDKLNIVTYNAITKLCVMEAVADRKKSSGKSGCITMS